MGTIGFWSQCIILLGDHFTGARSYFLPVYHFTETSFYRNNFVKVSVSFLSVSFYSSTSKFCNAMYHFTGSLWLHWLLVLTKSDIFSRQTHWRPTERVVFIATDTTVPPPLNSRIRTRNYMCIYFIVVSD